LNINNSQIVKKNLSMNLIHNYTKQNSEETDTTLRNKHFNLKGKQLTPVKKGVKKFLASSIENQNSARKTNLLKVSLKNEIKKIHRNVFPFVI
jgi:hypothetical protein